MKEPNHITGENPITGLHALVEFLVLCSLCDYLQDTDMETDSSTVRAQVWKDQGYVEECLASNREGKGPDGKPMVIYFLTQAVITMASFPFSVVSSCTQAYRFHGFWQPTRLWLKKKERVCVMKTVKALWVQSSFPFLVQPLSQWFSWKIRNKAFLALEQQKVGFTAEMWHCRC